MRRILPIAALLVLGGIVLAVTIGRNALKSDVDAPDFAQEASGLEQPASPASNAIKYENRRPEASGGIDPQKRAAIEREADQKALATHEAIAARFAAESVDVTWAAASEDKLLSASTSAQIAQMGAEPAALAFDCKATTCRVQADFASMSQAQDWFTLFTLNLGDALPASSFKYTTIPGGGARVTAYGVANR